MEVDDVLADEVDLLRLGSCEKFLEAAQLPARAGLAAVEVALERGKVADRRIEPDVEVLARGIGNGNAEIGGVARDVPVAQRLLALPGKPFARLVDHLRLQALRGVEPLTQKRDAARVRELEKEVIRGPQLRLCARDG